MEELTGRPRLEPQDPRGSSGAVSGPGGKSGAPTQHLQPSQAERPSWPPSQPPVSASPRGVVLAATSQPQATSPVLWPWSAVAPASRPPSIACIRFCYKQWTASLQREHDTLKPLTAAALPRPTRTSEHLIGLKKQQVNNGSSEPASAQNLLEATLPHQLFSPIQGAISPNELNLMHSPQRLVGLL